MKNNKGKIILAIGIVIVIILTGLIGIYNGIMKSDEKGQTKLFTDGCKSIAQNLKEYEETQSIVALNTAIASMKQMGFTVSAVKEATESLTRVDNFTKFISSFTVNSSAYGGEMERIISAFEEIAENPDTDYPYIQLGYAMERCVGR